MAIRGAFVDAFYYCPYHPEARIAKYRGCNVNRKPGPGMILKAFSDLAIRKNQSFLIGDKESDMEAAKSAGIPGFLFPGGNLAMFLDRLLGSEASLNRVS